MTLRSILWLSAAFHSAFCLSWLSRGSAWMTLLFWAVHFLSQVCKGMLTLMVMWVFSFQWPGDCNSVFHQQKPSCSRLMNQVGFCLSSIIIYDCHINKTFKMHALTYVLQLTYVDVWRPVCLVGSIYHTYITIGLSVIFCLSIYLDVHTFKQTDYLSILISSGSLDGSSESAASCWIPIILCSNRTRMSRSAVYQSW